MVSGSDRVQIENQLRQQLQSVSEWLVDNKLTLNLGKTDSILIGSKHKLKSSTNLNLTCNGTSTDSAKCVKYLGAVLDQSLAGEEMANGILGKVHTRLKFFYRSSKFLDIKTREAAGFSFDSVSQ